MLESDTPEDVKNSDEARRILREVNRVEFNNMNLCKSTSIRILKSPRFA